MKRRALLSSAGDPGQLQKTLPEWMQSFQSSRHSESVEFVVVDDASPHDWEQFRQVAQQAARNSGIPTFLLSEHGRAKGKARLRNDILARVESTLDPIHMKALGDCLSPGMFGGINTAFIAGQGLTTNILIEQDSYPRDGDRLEIVNVLDPCIDLIEETTSIPHARYSPDWGDTGSLGTTTFTGQVSSAPVACHFDTSGDLDYPATHSWGLLRMTTSVSGPIDPVKAGPRPDYLPESRPLASAYASSDRPTAIGTAMGFTGCLAPGLPFMPAIRNRSGDFLTGMLLAAASGIPAAWTGLALLHERSAITDSGRGQISHYIDTERHLWPFLYAVRAELRDVERIDHSAPGKWFRTVSQGLLRASQNFRLDTRLAAVCTAEQPNLLGIPEGYAGTSAHVRFHLEQLALQLYGWGALADSLNDQPLDVNHYLEGAGACD